MDFDARQMTGWWQKPLSEAERAERTERFFWLRVLVILGVWATVGVLGVAQVRRSSAGIRTAYELVKANDELRAQIESNRHAQARLTGMKNPNDLRKEAIDSYQMRAPVADEQVEVE